LRIEFLSADTRGLKLSGMWAGSSSHIALRIGERSYDFSREEHMVTKVLSLFVLLVCTFAVSQTPDPTPVDGKVSGRVMNADGKPVADATVYVVAQGPSLTDADRFHTRTNSRGYFDFGETLKHGVYEIYVQKDKDGYPDPFSTFYRPPDFTPET